MKIFASVRPERTIRCRSPRKPAYSAGGFSGMPSLFNSRRAFSRSVSSAFISPGLFFGGFNRFLPRLCLEGCIFGAVEHRKRLFSQPMTLGEEIGESFQHIRDYSNRADGHLYLQIIVARCPRL